MKFNEMRKNLSPKQEKLARLFQKHEITSYSKAVKALATHDDAQITTWKAELDAKLNPESESIPEIAPEVDYEFPFQAVNAAKQDPWARKLGYYIVRKANDRFDYGHAGHGKLEANEEIWR
jgi:hypothetical protein